MLNKSDLNSTYHFPESFEWGTAISAHQTEGNNKNSDWWEWEISKDVKREFPLEPSEIACDFYTRYEEDFELAENMNNTSIRLSIEWSRIEPTEGFFDTKVLEHYLKMLRCARKHNLKTHVTLNHFTLPVWISKQGGWENFEIAGKFARYSKVSIDYLKDYIDVIYTINEPQVLALMAYVNGTWPPCKRNLVASLIVQINLMRAHCKAYQSIKKITLKPVGIVKNIVWYEANPNKPSLFDVIASKFLYFLNCDFFIVPIKHCLDVIGLNYYFTNRFTNLKIANPNQPVNDLAWWINFEGLYNILVDLKKFNLPIYITENGLADSSDSQRIWFIDNMLKSVHRAIQNGTDVRGYLHWSLIDNYEWHNGYWPRFGLIEIDRTKDLKRIPRKSYYHYAQICKHNRIEIVD